MNEVNLGVVVGHRNVFPGSLAESGRTELLEVLGKRKINTIILDEKATPFGAVASHADARKYAAFFSENRQKIDGILISLADFGDESSLATLVRLAKLEVPVFIHAFPDARDGLSVEHRRDAFCGKLSLCNNLKQFGLKYSVGERHVVSPRDAVFATELDWFLGVCRVVKGLRSARMGCIGARTPDFNTVRFSEKLLEQAGISTVTVDLSDLVADAGRLRDGEAQVKERRAQLDDYVFSTGTVPEEKAMTITKMSLAVERWVAEQELDAYAIQCWPSMQKSLGIFPCIFMSFMSDKLIPSACETDVLGAVSMYALQLATGRPSGLFDLNNNYGNDPNRMVLFHCSNCPVSLMKKATAGYNAMAVEDGSTARAYSTLHGNLKRGTFTFGRVSTDDASGRITSYIGEGEVVDEPIDSFGTVGVMEVKGLQKLLRFLCRQGFEHHVALNEGRSADILYEAFTNYLGWQVHYHGEQEL